MRGWDGEDSWNSSSFSEKGKKEYETLLFSLKNFEIKLKLTFQRREDGRVGREQDPKDFQLLSVTK